MMNIIRSVNHAAQWFAVRLYTRGSWRADRQRGASALEYIVLAAAVIFIIGILVSNTHIQNMFQNAFSNLISSATSAVNK